MSSYKLVYANARGRGELIRLIFAYVEQSYEDVRIPMTDLQAERAKAPYGILPVLNVDDKVLSGNSTIARYLAEKYGLAGGNELENAEIFGVIEATEDLWIKLILYFYETDETKKAELRKKILEMAVPFVLSKFEKKALTNDCPEGWIHGNKVTYADFAIFALLDILKDHIPNITTMCPALNKTYQAVSQLPNIAKWLTSRPQTPH